MVSSSVLECIFGANHFHTIMTRICFYSTKPYDKIFFDSESAGKPYEMIYEEASLNRNTLPLSTGAEVVCIFVNDTCNAEVIAGLKKNGVKLIALRCAGFNNVDLQAAADAGITVVRVPSYSPEAVAEHAVALLLTLNRKTHKAYNRVREQNFALNGLLGFDIHDKVVGVIGTGNIGKMFCRIMNGFGCKVIAFDLYPDKNLEAMGVTYVTMDELLSTSDIVSLHCPLNEHTRHLINRHSVMQMKDGVVLINTSRGGLIDTKAAIVALKSGKLGGLAIDVYEQEEHIFFRDLSADIIQDDIIQRLMSFPNVLITAHQAFFTREALSQIARTTLGNIKSWQEGNAENTVTA